jgi:hypothetical protein
VLKAAELAVQVVVVVLLFSVKSVAECMRTVGWGATPYPKGSATSPLNDNRVSPSVLQSGAFQIGYEVSKKVSMYTTYYYDFSSGSRKECLAVRHLQPLQLRIHTNALLGADNHSLMLLSTALISRTSVSMIRCLTCCDAVLAASFPLSSNFAACCDPFATVSCTFDDAIPAA